MNLEEPKNGLKEGGKKEGSQEAEGAWTRRRANDEEGKREEEEKVTPAAAPAAAYASTSVYPSAAEAKKALGEAFNYWSGKLTDHSFQFALAIIGANWAVHRSAEAILANSLAIGSLSVIVVGLALNLIGSMVMGELHLHRFVYAEKDDARWKREYEATRAKVDPWPFTGAIELVGTTMRWTKLLFPIVGAGVFFLSLMAGAITVAQ